MSNIKSTLPKLWTLFLANVSHHTDCVCYLRQRCYIFGAAHLSAGLWIWPNFHETLWKSLDSNRTNSGIIHFLHWRASQNAHAIAANGIGVVCIRMYTLWFTRQGHQLIRFWFDSGCSNTLGHKFLLSRIMSHRWAFTNCWYIGNH